jgi:hypothetical protein
VQSRLVKVAACLSQSNGTRGTVNQLSAKFLFKGGDLFADGWLTNSAFFRDSGEAPLLNDPDERLHRIQSVHKTSPFPFGIDHALHAKDSLLESVSRENCHRTMRIRFAFPQGIAGIPKAASLAAKITHQITVWQAGTRWQSVESRSDSTIL